MKDIIDFGDLLKVDIRIGEVMTAEKVEKSDKLIKMTVFFGEEIGTRIVVSGIADKGFTPEDMITNKFPFVLNLTPRKMFGILSEAMIVMSENSEGNYNELSNADATAGDIVL